MTQERKFCEYYNSGGNSFATRWCWDFLRFFEKGKNGIFKIIAAFPTHSSFLHRRVCNKARTDVTQLKLNTNGIW